MQIQEGAVVGDRCHIEDGAVVRTMIKLWPDKVIEADSQVTSSLIWGSKHHASLFRGLGVPGITNIEMTPEFATKLGASYGAFIKKGATVVAARDGHPASRMLRRALMAGLSSVGCNVLDVQALPLPVARTAIRANNAQGGINVRVDPDHPRNTLVEFFDKQGIYLTPNAERKIETIFFREDYGRTDMAEVGEIDFAARTVEQYTQQFYSALKVARHRATPVYGRRGLRLRAHRHGSAGNFGPLGLRGDFAERLFGLEPRPENAGRAAGLDVQLVAGRFDLAG